MDIEYKKTCSVSNIFLLLLVFIYLLLASKSQLKVTKANVVFAWNYKTIPLRIWLA